MLFSVKPHAGQQGVAAWLRQDLPCDQPPRNEKRLQDRYSIRCAPHVIGVLADAFYPKSQESAEGLVNIIADTLGHGPVERNPESTPVWIPRNGKDHKGVPFVVLTCTRCLRSFPFSVSHEPNGNVESTPCIYCPHEIAYIIDFSRSVNSPEKRAAWKAAFLKTLQINAA